VPGTLHLVPTPLGDVDPVKCLPPMTLQVARRLTHWIVETPKTARRILGRMALDTPLQSLQMQVLDVDTPGGRLASLLEPLLAGNDVGLISDAGSPALADPGAALVRLAHARGIPVSPLPGPSAILLALMASGMNGQRFAFHGYLPVAAPERRRVLTALERTSRRDDVTQIVIETPYRNARLFDDAVAACAEDTLLGIAVDLTLPTQWVATRPIGAWRGRPPDFDRRPAIFLLYAGR